MNPNPARIAEIRRMVDDPALDRMRTIAKMAKQIAGAFLENGRGEIEAALIARGFSLKDIHDCMPSALVIIQEFGRGK